MLTTSRVTMIGCVCLLGACHQEPPRPLAKKAGALEVAEPEGATVIDLAVSGPSQIEFMMDAPIEKIQGIVPASATSGELHLDIEDITRSTGIVRVDLAGLELWQTKADDTGAFGDKTKNETQNEHARAWLEIGEDAPAAAVQSNRRVEFSLASVKNPSANSPTVLTGKRRAITFTAVGEFLLHGRKTTKEVELEAVFEYECDQPVAVEVRTVKPFAVNLPEHDVRPRTGFGTLAQKTLGALSDKVSPDAKVTLSIRARGPTGKDATLASAAVGSDDGPDRASATVAVPEPATAQAQPDTQAGDDEAPVMTLADVEREHILATLERFDGDKIKTAKALNIGRFVLAHKLRRYEKMGKLGKLEAAARGRGKSPKHAG